MSCLRVLVTLFLAVVGTSHASVTAAWKIPVERVAPSFADAPPLDKPPGASAFFQGGDQLWDLSKKLNWRVPDDSQVDGETDPFAVPEPGEKEIDWKGDWIVWNSRSGMIVARGSWHDVLVAEQALGCDELPKVVRCRIEVKGIGKPRAVSLVSVSGEKATLEMNGLRAEVEPTTSSDGDVIDSPFRVSWPAEDGRGTWSVITAVSLQEGSPRRIACQGTKDQRWELVVSGSAELLDGTPWKEFRWMETPAGLKPWPNSGVCREPVRKQLDGNRWLGVYPMVPGFASYFSKRARVKANADILPPAELAEWTLNPLVDIRQGLGDHGGVVFQDEGHFAGMDPSTCTAFVVTDQLNQDRVEAVFLSILDGDFQPPNWIETNAESGGWGLASRSGETGEIRRASGNLAENLQFRSEVTQGGDGVTFDLRYSLDVVADGSKIGKLESNTVLTKDKPQVIGSGSAADGKEVKVSVTASHARE
jgi:hypothetical protein